MIEVLSMLCHLKSMHSNLLFHRQTFTEALGKFFDKLSNASTAHLHLYLLFNLLTHHHFIDKHAEPFGYPEQDPKKIKWCLATSSQNSFRIQSFLFDKLNPKLAVVLFCFIFLTV